MNLASEEILFRSLPDCHVCIFGYTNRPCIVIGRNQNPWLECDLTYLQHQGIGLYRRQSGGGAVCHDLGVFNLALLSSAHRWSIEEFMGLLSNVLGRFGVPAELTPRHGLQVGGLKISGSASWLTGRACLHHASVLFHADLNRLRRALQPPALRLSGHLVRSVPSPVVNLADLCPSLVPKQFFAAVLEQVATQSGCLPPRPADPATSGIPQDARFQTARETHESSAWRFGRTPAFTHRLTVSWEDGSGEVELQVENGYVVRFSTAAAVPRLTETVSACDRQLRQRRYGPELVSAILAMPRGSADLETYRAAIVAALHREVH